MSLFTVIICFESSMIGGASNNKRIFGILWQQVCPVTQLSSPNDVAPVTAVERE